MIRTIVVDDEALAREGLIRRLGVFPDIEIIGECGSGRAALNMILARRPDLAFLDIEMPGLNGIELAAQLPAELTPQIVFVTAHNQYAMEAFDRAALGYLLKPAQADRLAATVERIRALCGRAAMESERDKLLAALRQLSQQPRLTIRDVVAGRLEPDALLLTERGEQTRVPLAEIEYVEAAGDYMCIAAGGTTHVVRTSLKSLFKRLRPAGFLRVHRSTIVNSNRIRRFRSNGHGDGWVQLADGTELRCSRTHRPFVQALLQAQGAQGQSCQR